MLVNAWSMSERAPVCSPRLSGGARFSPIRGKKRQKGPRRRTRTQCMTFKAHVDAHADRVAQLVNKINTCNRINSIMLYIIVIYNIISIISISITKQSISYLTFT